MLCWFNILTLRTNHNLLPCKVTEIAHIPQAIRRQSHLALSQVPTLYNKGLFIIHRVCFIIYSQMSLPAGATGPEIYYSTSLVGLEPIQSHPRCPLWVLSHRLRNMHVLYKVS